jgi:hypothetical protein
MALNKLVTSSSQVSLSSGKIPVFKNKNTGQGKFEFVGNASILDDNITIRNTKVDDTFFSSKLLNIVEPVNVEGQIKTAFYTELSTSFNKGDRVYILNGFYDSDDYIQKDKYNKYTDGYRVLGCDGCKVILDLDYTGQLPFTDPNLDDCIFVHSIKTLEQFKYVNSTSMGLSYSYFDGKNQINLTSNSQGQLYSPFQAAFRRRPSRLEILGGNILYSSSQFTISKADGPLISPNTPFGFRVSAGFHVKIGSNWTDMSLFFDANNFKLLNPKLNPKNITGNKKILILGEDFTYKNFTFKERCIYRYSNEKKTWVFDKTYKQPVISKMNFRGGLFKDTGIHNDGVFGSYDKVVNWKDATWKSGFFVNANWVSGTMQSKSIAGRKYNSAKLSLENGVRTALQNSDTTNNNGFGYNYIIDSTLRESLINNGNFENSNIGIVNTTSAIDNYYNNTFTYSVIIKNGRVNFCDINSSSLERGNMNDSILTNCQVKKTKLINNQMINSVANETDYIDEGGIQILGADVYSYYLQDFADTIDDYSDIRGVLKLFISNEDYLRLEKGDSFYLEKINKDLFLTSLNKSQRILLPLETRYFLDYYYDEETTGFNEKISVSLKNKTENQIKFNVQLVDTISTISVYTPAFKDGNGDFFDVFWSRTPYTGGLPNFDADYQYTYRANEHVIYESFGVKRVYKYLGVGDGSEYPEIPNPIERDPNGVYWYDLVGVYKGLWVPEFMGETELFSINPTDVYEYIDYGVRYGLIRTPELPQDNPGLGDFYQTETVPGGVEDKRTLFTTDSKFNLCSIDLDSKVFGYYKSQNNETIRTNNSDLGLSGVPIDFVNQAFLGTYIKPSDFRSGLMIDSRWLSGYNQNYYPNIIRKVGAPNARLGVASDNSLDSLDIFFSTNNVLKVRLFNNPFDLAIKKRGLDIVSGDTVWLTGVFYRNDVTTIDLSGRYTVSSITFVSSNSDEFLEVNISPVGFSLVGLINAGANYGVIGAEDSNYVTLSKFRIERSTITTGFFRRTNLQDCVISNGEFNNQDASFTQTNVVLLRFVNTIFSGNNITIDDGFYFNSHIVDPIFRSGIVHESIWNTGTFEQGIFSSGFWKNGLFKFGRFLDSRSTLPIAVYFSSGFLYKSWFSGTFSSGEMVNSDWLDGTFNNGRFYNSDFYGGVWNNGILGIASTPAESTTFGHYRLDGVGGTCSIWKNGTVENALMGGDGVVYWYNGRYLGGEFTSYGSDPTKESIWYNGEFYGSEITHLARWKTGNFNSGKFLSYYGWEKASVTSSSVLPEDYGWENGRFINGEFGYKGLTANSVWYNGQFLNGSFVGRLWRNGYFYNGRFQGSISWDFATTQSNVSNYLENYYADSYRENFYGLWLDGVAVDNVSEGEFAGPVNLVTGRLSGESAVNLIQKSIFSGLLWMGGTFSHRFATMKDSLFVNGSFNNGEFDNGVFNPYIDRTFSGLTYGYSFGNNTKWNEGRFLNGYFWSSDWRRGRFYNGYMSGARWNTGTWYYGTAENIYWNDGLWKNGNWNGTPYDYSLIEGTVSFLFSEETADYGTFSRYVLKDGREKDVIYKVSSYNNDSKYLHLMNVFSASNPITYTADAFTGSRSWTHSAETYVGTVDQQTNPKLPPILRTANLLSCSWAVFPNFDLVRSIEDGIYYNSQNQLQSVKKPVFNDNTGKFTLTVGDSNLATFGGQLPYTSGIEAIGYNYHNPEFRDLDSGESRKLYFMRGGTTSIFTNATVGRKYTVSITLSVELAPTVEVEIYVGALSYSTYQLTPDTYKWTDYRSPSNYTQYEDYYAKVYTITTTYNVTSDSVSTGDGQVLWIRKASRGILRLLKAVITYQQIEYNLQFNNRLALCLNTFGLDETLYGKQVDFPTYSVTLNTASDNGKEVGLNFGNGVFKSGIWENGVWNNGFRSFSKDDGWAFGQSSIQDDLVKAIDIDLSKTYKINNTTWRVTLNVISANISVLKLNKKVSVGNIVGIDLNNRRQLFRDPVEVVSIDSFQNKITLKFVSNFPLQQILKDSNNHLIYITQNIWLNGVFLNGYFRGVWNNGVMKGFPRISEMYETNFIDGVIDGGHFKSEQLYDDENRVFYNSGLIQNMTFYDNNQNAANKLFYKTWLDLYYYKDTVVNINLPTKYFSTNNVAATGDLKGKGEIIINTPNLVGYPTQDVLSSISYFRDFASTTTRKYSLGSKKTRFKNFIPDDGNFKAPISSVEPKVGMDYFFRNGWTYSYWEPDDYPRYKLIVDSNTNAQNGGILRILGSNSFRPGFTNNLSLFYNTNTLDTLDNRYYESVLILNSEIPSTQQIFLNIDDNALNSFNHETTSSLTKIEYFYNKNGNHLLFGINGTVVPRVTNVKNMSFYEVDMVPFFQYFTASGIDYSVKTPFVGTAPVIDYTNQNFDFIGNVDLGIDYKVIAVQNLVSTSRLVRGTSIPVDYNTQIPTEASETDFGGNIVSGDGQQ